MVTQSSTDDSGLRLFYLHKKARRRSPRVASTQERTP